MNASNALVCTVGTGDKNRIEETLLNPLKQSLRTGQWETIVLLPSQGTKVYAERLCEEEQPAMPGCSIEIRPLPAAGEEDDADACFAHFDSVLASLIQAGVQPRNITADFTRGTKAMSAALVLAAVRHGLPVVRYLSGAQRDERGMVVAGSEKVLEIQTIVVTAQRRLDDAVRFFRQGDFPAAADTVRPSVTEQWPETLRNEAERLRTWADFYAAWDRLDYREAARLADQFHAVGADQNLPTDLNSYAPTPKVIEWVKYLAADLPDELQGKARSLRSLVIDLLANGERRLAHRQYEDALIRAYRVLELLGQARLFDKGYDSAALPPEDEKVRDFQDHLTRKKDRPLEADQRSGKLKASREQVARFLKFLNDDFGQKLIDTAEAKEGGTASKRRNQSVLIHGFAVVSDAEGLAKLYRQLEALVREDGGAEVDDRLKTARSVPYPSPELRQKT
ncbi:MAG: TIGR02710 family CRISPR-associated CARF protein [Chloracidobacterium sp.]|nr:TIGR02710 family CRISPR-associated CARF protein [Chloracidobacterium sp.]MDW8218690.1 TIGR02710 family CRISPR-associated CARF protein [Acidobacteriota bacterium]